ncbi:MAG: Phenylacetate-coenzyme A ligase [Firmicutes bacterium ADurb.Bin456]|nr:MAG: Phenylacetate-coenzyme A ligase [Firmicutes bacterium ADurb.Bin456]
MYQKTPLESWILGKVANKPGGPAGLTRSMIEDYQIRKLRETLTLAVKSPFYRRRLGRIEVEKFRSVQDIRHIPFTSAGDLARNPLQMLCVSQDSINRVVTLDSSGTTGEPKRVFFTAADQELTRDFFHHGMSTLVRPGNRVLILLPCELPGSVGDLLAEGLQRLPALPVRHGLVRDPKAVMEIIAKERIDSLVGIPTQVLSLAYCEPVEWKKRGVRLKDVLLSTDHVPASLAKQLEKTWGCRVFNHYGMTETGLGGGVECEALAGYHLREADLLFEIVDPGTGEVLPAGEEGEVVFTTLTRRGMPLIRYRTGDLARFIPEPCPCQTVLKRMSPVKDRVRGRVALTGGGCLSMSMLDEAIFSLRGVINFRAVLSSREGGDVLQIIVQTAGNAAENTPSLVEQALISIPVISVNAGKGSLDLAPVELEPFKELWQPQKRVIQDLRYREPGN